MPSTARFSETIGPLMERWNPVKAWRNRLGKKAHHAAPIEICDLRYAIRDKSYDRRI